MDLLLELDLSLPVAALCAAGAVLCLVLGLQQRLTYARVEGRLEMYVGLAPTARPPVESREPLKLRLARLVSRVGAGVDGILPDRQIERIKGNLAAAGYGSNRHLTNFLAAKALLGVGLALAGPLLFAGSDAPAVLEILLAAIGGAVGFYLPGVWLGGQIKQRRQSLSRALPDALDLLSIGVGAGLGFESALVEVTQRWQNPLTEELSGVLRDLRLGKTRREALRSLADRTAVPEIATFVAAVVQAEELGTTLRETLRVQGEQVRQQRRQKAEERARQATIKMLIPMALFIFPSIFVILLGPAIPALMSLRR